MQELNNHQLVLLVLLVSFVTSVATGIMTVTLLDQAPQEVTQTINRVVERTVEKVVPGGIQTVIKEVPVMVTEEALIVKAINKASGAVVHVVSDGGSNTKSSGFLVTPAGLVVTVRDESDTGNAYRITLESGEIFNATLVKRNLPGRVTLLRITQSDMDDFTAAITKHSPLTFSTQESIVGQTVVGIGIDSSGNNAVSVSIIAGITASSTPATSAAIKTNAATTDTIGGPLLDIHGNVVGISVSVGSGLPKEVLSKIIDENK